MTKISPGFVVCLTTSLFICKPTKNSDRFDCSFFDLIPPFHFVCSLWNVLAWLRLLVFLGNHAVFIHHFLISCSPPVIHGPHAKKHCENPVLTVLRGYNETKGNYRKPRLAYLHAKINLAHDMPLCKIG